MYSADELKRLIEAGLPDAQVEVAGDDGVHFAARVISPSFSGKGIVEQHRMVYAALGERMGGDIHALSLRTLTPEQAGR
ncbi:BolA/IbaG family iron-sulfur metabolism protein [Salinisphaera sp. PC39]|uniref:BolA family protein n=1 Tax=Salinisphaera sp. PC39 TaxID=1304156 RepID=UPI003340AF27